MRFPSIGIPAQSGLQLFRVSADWPGGGVYRTLPFPDAEAARAWALNKAKGREDVMVFAVPRGPAPVLPAPFRESDFEPTLTDSERMVQLQGFVGGMA